MNIIFVGPAEGLYRPAMETLGKAGHSVQWFRSPEAFHGEADVSDLDVLVGVGPVNVGGAVMARAPRLRALISPVTGTEGFDEAEATRRGILIANGQIPENYISMAEATVALILAALYDLNGAQRMLAENAPRPRTPAARMLFAKTVGLIGFGRISQSVAERLSTFGCRIVTSVRTPRALPAFVTALPIDDLLAGSDVVVVLTALNDTSRHLLTAERLRRMKSDVILVNVARGGIVDETALIEVARERPEMRLAFDVFETEPLPMDSPLRQIGNAILTPHAVGHTRETIARLPAVLLENVTRVIAGEAPDYVRNPQVVAAWLERWGRG